MPLIRYPGSKAKLLTVLANWFPDWARGSMFADGAKEYREPFMGSGAATFFVLPNLHCECRVWLNDIDADLMALWQSIRDAHKELMQLVVDFKPSVDAFFSFKQQDNATRDSAVMRGFRKLALHRMSVSGFGYMTGGPIGGRGQGTAYNVECRWNSSRIKKQIKFLHRTLKRFGNQLHMTSLPFSDVIKGAGNNCFIYCDPPYYEKGPALYRYSMTDGMHAELAHALRVSASEWVTSYDDHPRIRELYSWARIHELEVRYSNAVLTGTQGRVVRPKNKEVAIHP